MRFFSTKLNDVYLIEPQVHADDRGYFTESWNRDHFARRGLDLTFPQDNHSCSKAGTLRGMHYQVFHPQGKLVRVVEGSVFDVAVDLRKASSTFGEWAGFELSEDNHRMLWVPPGFAHGFYVHSESAHFLYKCTDIYSPEHERTIRWDDPDLAIDWPLAGATPLVSGKDESGVRFRDAEHYS